MEFDNSDFEKEFKKKTGTLTAVVLTLLAVKEVVEVHRMRRAA